VCYILGFPPHSIFLYFQEKGLVNNNLPSPRKISKIMAEGIDNVAVTLDDEKVDLPPQYPALHI